MLWESPKELSWDWFLIITFLGVIPENCSRRGPKKLLLEWSHNTAWEWSQRTVLGVIPDYNFSGSNPRKLLQELSQRIALGVIPEKSSGSDPWKLVQEWSQEIALVFGVIPENCCGSDPRDLFWDHYQTPFLGVVPETSSGSDPIVVLYHPNPIAKI